MKPIRCFALQMMFAILVVCGFTAASRAQTLATPPAGLPAPLTLVQAIALALRNNPSGTLAAQDVQVAEQQLNAARAGRLPTAGVNVTAQYDPSPTTVSLNGEQVQISSAFASSANATISQPVWPPARWQAPIQSARAGVSISQEALTRTRQQIVFQTSQAFFQLQGAIDLQQVADSSVGVARTQLRLAESTVNAGLAAPLDVFQARATLADAEVTAVRAQNSVSLARAALATQLGLPAGTPITIVAEGPLPALPADVEALVKTALAQRPELAQLNGRRQQLRAAIAQIKLEQQPLINVQASYAQALAGGSALGADGLMFGAGASLNFFNGGKTRASVRAAETQLAQIDTSARQLELGITLDVRQAWLNLQNALEQLGAAERGREAAAEALRIAEIRYQNGEGIVLEVEQARLKYTQALTALAQARSQAKIAAAQLAYVTGAPVP